MNKNQGGSVKMNKKLTARIFVKVFNKKIILARIVYNKNSSAYSLQAKTVNNSTINNKKSNNTGNHCSTVRKKSKKM